jgi:two-component system phosphate regulon sensor histidine kinase PhoR
MRETKAGYTFDSSTARMARRPITWTMTAQAPPQTPSEFESVLLAIAGHDLRQPLQAIQSAQDMLGRGIRTESELRALRSGQTAIDRLKDQLDELIVALRLREHVGEVELTPVHLGPLFQQACRENGTEALRKAVSLRIAQTTATIHSNALLLSTILRNLVSNAIKYTQPGGRVLLGCRHAGRRVRIDVYDTGVGMTGDQMPRIFEPFTRLDPAGQEGLGVGLFIVRQAIGILGHRIDIISAPSQGSRFSIFVTKAESSAAQPRQADYSVKTSLECSREIRMPD